MPDYSYSYFAPDNTIRISTDPPKYKKEWNNDLVLDNSKQSPPKCGDFVIWGDRKGWITRLDRAFDAVTVKFNDDDDEEELSFDSFNGNYTSNGRRHTWTL